MTHAPKGQAEPESLSDDATTGLIVVGLFLMLATVAIVSDVCEAAVGIARAFAGCK